MKPVPPQGPATMRPDGNTLLLAATLLLFLASNHQVVTRLEGTVVRLLERPPAGRAPGALRRGAGDPRSLRRRLQAGLAISAGDKVVSNYYGTGYFMEATVMGPAEKSQDGWVVVYDSQDTETVSLSKLVPYPVYELGDEVWFQSGQTGWRWRRGSLVDMPENGDWTVTDSEGATFAVEYAWATIRDAARLEVGAGVWAEKASNLKYFRGTVVEVSPSGLYTVQFDSGEQEKDVLGAYLVPIPGAAPAAGGGGGGASNAVYEAAILHLLYETKRRAGAGAFAGADFALPTPLEGSNTVQRADYRLEFAKAYADRYTDAFECATGYTVIPAYQNTMFSVDAGTGTMFAPPIDFCVNLCPDMDVNLESVPAQPVYLFNSGRSKYDGEPLNPADVRCDAGWHAPAGIFANGEHVATCDSPGGNWTLAADAGGYSGCDSCQQEGVALWAEPGVSCNVSQCLPGWEIDGDVACAPVDYAVDEVTLPDGASWVSGVSTVSVSTPFADAIECDTTQYYFIGEYASTTFTAEFPPGFIVGDELAAEMVADLFVDPSPCALLECDTTTPGTATVAAMDVSDANYQIGSVVEVGCMPGYEGTAGGPTLTAPTWECVLSAEGAMMWTQLADTCAPCVAYDDSTSCTTCAETGIRDFDDSCQVACSPDYENGTATTACAPMGCDPTDPNQLFGVDCALPQCESYSDGQWRRIIRTTGNGDDFGQASLFTPGNPSRYDATADTGVYDAYFDVRNFDKVMLRREGSEFVILDMVEASNNRSMDDLLRNCAATGHQHAHDSGPENNAIDIWTAGYGASFACGSMPSAQFGCSGGSLQYLMFCGVNRSSDNDASMLAFTSDTGVSNCWSDSWRGAGQEGTAWSFWNNDFHSTTDQVAMQGAAQGYAGYKQGSGTYEVWIHCTDC